ncbi:ParB/RepB/Spo0J family partition protein [Sphingosinicella terrae]|uniref:ParB/RepB/Spo0J family partition protein n=1 Tax=Sphingosinicella terrae TaxID=2172047 RepID=UPI002549383C|nr:ParB/RepB/Spo0J family partition protein [Sphingosinicella terrae]
MNKLMPSPRNVRRATHEQADLQLKADIEARGLLQNLVVASSRKPRGRFTVEAGGRRFRALASLAKEGKLPADHEVCCLVVDGAPAAVQEAGLAENFQRLAMNPADECLAFGQLIEQGADVEGVARRFGLTVRFVEGRLRLANLAPVVFEALGAGEITLDVAKAYGATPDRERQAFVFEQVSRSYMAQHPDSIRRMMTQATVSASDRRARFVGEEAYVAAGGRIERDLFSDEDDARWLDIALLERLATDKLEALATDKAEELGLAWVRPALESWIGHPATAGLQRVAPEREPLTENEACRIETAHAEIEALIAVIDDEETADDVRQEAEEKAEALEREIAALRHKPAIIDEALRPKLGAFLQLDDSGAPVLGSVFYSEATDHKDEEPGDDTGVDRPDTPAPVKEPEPQDRPQAISRALLDELAIQRRDVLAVHVAADPGLALDLAIFLMVDRDAGHSSGRSGSSLLALQPSDPVFGFKTPDAPATVARAQAVEALERSWTEGATRGERFDAFRALPEEARAAWLSHAVARTLEASANSAERMCPFHDHVGALLEIDVAKWWRPTGVNYFDRVPKAVTLAALEEVGGPSFASRYAGLKKAQLSQSAERIFAGDFIADVEVKERALDWVPEPMRFAPPAASSVPAADETPPWEDEPAAAPDKDLPAETAPESGGGAPEAGGDEPSETIEEAA